MSPIQVLLRYLFSHIKATWTVVHIVAEMGYTE